jgi:hypothetical protein
MDVAVPTGTLTLGAFLWTTVPGRLSAKANSSPGVCLSEAYAGWGAESIRTMISTVVAVGADAGTNV